MTDNAEKVFPEPSFSVFSASRQLVGYGAQCADDLCEICFPEGEDEGFVGVVSGSDVEFSSGNLAGHVSGETVRYADGQFACVVRGDEFFDEEGALVARTEGKGNVAARGGAVLLLVLCRWSELNAP